MKIYQSELLKFNLTEKLWEGINTQAFEQSLPSGIRVEIFIYQLWPVFGWAALGCYFLHTSVCFLKFWGRILGTDVGRVTWMLAATYKRVDSRGKMLIASITVLLVWFCVSFQYRHLQSTKWKAGPYLTTVQDSISGIFVQFSYPSFRLFVVPIFSLSYFLYISFYFYLFMFPYITFRKRFSVIQPKRLSD